MDMYMRKVSEPVAEDDGTETHPAFGFIHASRVSSNPGAVLFDSDIKHVHFVTLTIQRATRKRELNRDWLFGRQELIEVAMSEAQWASFVSSMNTSGVPCTIRATSDDHMVDGVPYAPRLQQSMDDVREAANRAYTEVVEAMAAYDALDKTATAKQRRDALQTLRSVIRNATPNVTYAGKTLNEHVENVVQRVLTSRRW